MRTDMHEVITSRPRSGSSYSKRTHCKAPEDQTKVRMKDGLYYGKVFNDHLTPLIRLLEKRIGRSWNKTYSDICEGLTKNGLHRNHIKEHLRYMVETDPLRVAEIKEHRTSGFRFFYVDNGILRQKSRRR